MTSPPKRGWTLDEAAFMAEVEIIRARFRARTIPAPTRKSDEQYDHDMDRCEQGIGSL